MIVALFVAAMPCLQARAESWQPPPPMPDDFDWVQLKSGEWLKGQIKALYQDSLEFDSEELDLQNFDLQDITVIRSAQIITLRVRDGRTATGRLLLDGDSVTVIGDRETRFTRADILTVTAGVGREINYWSGDISFGGNFRYGNTEQVDANVNLGLQRRTVVSRITIDHVGNFSRTSGVETANTQRGNVTWDKFRSAKVFTRPLFGEYFTDPFQNIARRYTIGVGAGYQLRDTPKTDWNIFVGPAYQQTDFDEVEVGQSESEGTWALSAGMNYNTDLTNRLEWDYVYQFQLTSEDAGDYNHHMISTLKIDLTDSLNLDLSAQWDKILTPRPNADGSIPQQDDYRLIIGIGYNF
jgi:putative salt-induced outer membrane protein YdiY